MLYELKYQKFSQVVMLYMKISKHIHPISMQFCFQIYRFLILKFIQLWKLKTQSLNRGKIGSEETKTQTILTSEKAQMSQQDKKV